MILNQLSGRPCRGAIVALRFTILPVAEQIVSLNGRSAGELGRRDLQKEDNGLLSTQSSTVVRRTIHGGLAVALEVGGQGVQCMGYNFLCVKRR